MRNSISFTRKTWLVLGGPVFLLWLTFALFVDVLVGAYIMKCHPRIFFAMERNMLQDWAVTYGVNNLRVTWWFFALLFLLFVLTLSTVVCTVERLATLINRRKAYGMWSFLLKLAPSLIHLGFLILLMGQLVSHTMAINLHGNILTLERALRVPGTDTKVKLKDLEIRFFEKGTQLLGMDETPKIVRGVLCFEDKTGIHEQKISINRPASYKGWDFFMEDFQPKSKLSKMIPCINIIIRKDPGIKIMIWGAVMFGLGLMLYLIQVVYSNMGGRPTENQRLKNQRNTQKRLMLIIAGLFIVFCAGCNPQFQQFGEFSIRSTNNGYKEITDGIGRKLLLVPRGQQVPNGYKASRAIQIPVTKVVVYSTYNAAMIKELGHVSSIVGVITEGRHWFIPEIKQGLKDGTVTYLGQYTSVDYEKLRALKPDVVFTWDESIVPKLEELSIPCVITSTKIAMDLASHINFIRFLSVFYGEERRARSFADAQFRKIDQIGSRIRQAKNTPKVVWGDIYERKVLVEPGNSWAGQMVEKAGGEYLFHDLEGASCMQVTLEKFFSRTKDADILITYRGPESGITSKEILRKSSSLLQVVKIKPMNEGRIYCPGYKVYQSADVAGIIRELASIFHPKLFPVKEKAEYFFELPEK